MMQALLTIERLNKLKQRLHCPEAVRAREERDGLRQEMRQSLGPDEAKRIERYVQATATPFSTGPMPFLAAESEEAFLTLLQLELRLRHAERHSEKTATFIDPYNARAVLPTLGLSWWADVRLLIDPPADEGHISDTNTKHFLKMATEARQWLPTQEQIEERGGKVDSTIDIRQWHEHFRQQRQELVSFLQRTVELEEGLWIRLMS